MAAVRIVTVLMIALVLLAALVTLIAVRMVLRGARLILQVGRAR